MILIVISENIFSKYIEFDNTKIKLIIKNLYLIYAKFIKRKKLEYFFKYRNNIILSTLQNNTGKNNKRKNSNNNTKVYDRLFNYAIIKEKMLYNLSNKYLIDEEDKYTFNPKINSKESNFYLNLQKLYEIPHKEFNTLTERNFYKPKNIKNIQNLKNNQDNYLANYIRKKYIPNKKNQIELKFKENHPNSFSQNNIHFFDLNSKSKINEIFPVDKRHKYNNLNNNILNNIEEEQENGEKNTYTNRRNLNTNRLINKSFSCKNYSSNRIFKKHQNINNKDLIHQIPIQTNNCTLSRNSDLSNYLKNKIKRDKNNFSKEILIPKRNGQNIEHEKKLVHSNNSSSSIYNLSSIGGSHLKENLKLKSHHSSNKKEHLFSFGSDLFYVDNNNSNCIKIKTANKKNNLIKRNSNLKTGSSVKSQKHQVSTKSSGTNTNSYYTNYNLNLNKEKNKNGLDKNIKLEIQGINEYSIINDLNNLDNEIFNIQTTLQTLTDSKILDLANNYIPIDDSLEVYKRNIGIYNKYV